MTNRQLTATEFEGRRRAGGYLRRKADRLDLDGNQYVHSTWADLPRRLGRGDEPRREYERALELANTEPELRFLERHLAEASAWSPLGAGSVRLCPSRSSSDDTN